MPGVGRRMASGANRAVDRMTRPSKQKAKKAKPKAGELRKVQKAKPAPKDKWDAKIKAAASVAAAKKIFKEMESSNKSRVAIKKKKPEMSAADKELKRRREASRKRGVKIK